MRQLLTTILLGMAMLATQAPAEPENGGDLKSDLIRVGVGILRHEMQKLEKDLGDVSPEAQQAAQNATQPEQEPMDAEAAAQPGKRGWRDRGKDVLGAFMGSAKDGLGEKPLPALLADSFKSSANLLINEYKEQYKAEGRAYARELGDTLVERIREDPKISRSITMVQVLCWTVIVYLTLVTIFMVVAVRNIKRDNSRLLALLEKVEREKREKD